MIQSISRLREYDILFQRDSIPLISRRAFHERKSDKERLQALILLKFTQFLPSEIVLVWFLLKGCDDSNCTYFF